MTSTWDYIIAKTKTNIIFSCFTKRNKRRIQHVISFEAIQGFETEFVLPDVNQMVLQT